MIVYKYMAAGRADVLQNGRIRFTQPAALNDPFETYPNVTQFNQKFLKAQIDDMEKLLGKPLEPTEIAELEKVLDEKALSIPVMFSEAFAVLSLTKQRNNLLMWSHYADSHRGFVLGFDTENDFFKKNDSKGAEGLREVEYSDTRWLLPPDGFTKATDLEMRRANTMLFFTKSEEWAYEEELRFLAQPQAADTIIPVSDGYDICLFDFPIDFIKEIIFGSRMNTVEKQRLATIITDKYPNAIIFEASLDPERFQLQVDQYVN